MTRDRRRDRSRNGDRSCGADRGVSEVIAFVIVFGIVITSVGLLYTVGFGAVADIQASEQDRSGDRAFHAVAVALDDMQRDRGSNRALDVDLSGRSLHVDESETLEVQVDGSYVGGNASGALIYGDGEDTEIAYQAGAMIRSEGPDAQIVRREPRFRCGDEYAVVSVVSLDGSDRTVTSDGSVRILAEQQNPDDSRLVGSGGQVTVDFGGSEYETAWQRYFQDQGWDSVSGGVATCDSPSAVYVRHTEIGLQYIGV